VAGKIREPDPPTGKEDTMNKPIILVASVKQCGEVTITFSPAAPQQVVQDYEIQDALDGHCLETVSAYDAVAVEAYAAVQYPEGGWIVEPAATA